MAFSAFNPMSVSERARLVASGGDTTYKAPNVSIDQVPRASLCQKCEMLAKSSKIVHQAPKIDWLQDQPDNMLLLTEPPVVAAEIPNREVFDHHNTIAALRRSARTCQLCTLLCAYDPEFPDVRYEALDNAYYNLVILRADNHMRGPGLLKINITRPLMTTGVTYLLDGAPPVKLETSLRYPGTDHHEVLSLAKKWLSTCIKEHEPCTRFSKLNDGWTLPTRLLKVTGFWTNVYSMRLCLGKDLNSSTPYLTLSHCWGGANDIVKLDETTLADFQEDIPVEILPKNFRDAAAITLCLGYEYLWIDSLCIIQDQASGEDWKKEAANMGNVYRHSLCTIAAMGARNPHDGCFMARDQRNFSPCQLVPNTKHRTGVWAENWRIQGPDPHQSRTPTLHTRGWVVQERALSLRTLYFGAQMIYWECICGRASEQEPDMAKLPRFFQLKNTFFGLIHTAKWDFPQTEWLKSWWRIIETYTRCNLSFGSDRWAAISGVLNIIEGRCPTSRLVYGLWEVDLDKELLWESVKPRKDKRIDNGAPSWSWLSVEAEVHKMRFKPQQFRHEIAVSLQAHPKDDSKIFIRARIAKMKWTVTIFGDGRREYKLRVHDRGRQMQGTWDGSWSPDLIPDQKWELWAMHFVGDETTQDTAGLVVKPITQDASVNWTRVGTYVISPEEVRRVGSHWNVGEMKTVTLV